MQQTTTDEDLQLAVLEELEQRIQFTSFDLEDAYTLGTMLRERGKTTPKPIAVRIVLDGLIAYQSFLPGTNETNNNWMDKKQRTVDRTHVSSMHAMINREMTENLEDWQQDEEHYAFCGGGFPLIVNGEYRGAAIISGLPHKEDHRNLVAVLEQFLAR